MSRNSLQLASRTVVGTRREARGLLFVGLVPTTPRGLDDAPLLTLLAADPELLEAGNTELPVFLRLLSLIARCETDDMAAAVL